MHKAIKKFVKYFYGNISWLHLVLELKKAIYDQLCKYVFIWVLKAYFPVKVKY